MFCADGGGTSGLGTGLYLEIRGQHGIEHFERGKDYAEYEFPGSNLWNMGDIVDLKMDRVNFEGSRFGETLIQSSTSSSLKLWILILS